MDYNIKLESLNFEGPFDLLLHLIKKNEMDIYDIKIYDITNEYLSYIKKMKEIDLEVTSEFIVVAATLLEIKSKMLLPKAENNDKEEEDPRANLVEKLVEYKRFKAVSEFLKEVIKENGQTFSKKAEIIDDSCLQNENKDVLKDITMLDLYNLYNELINRYRNKINENNTLLTQIPVDKFKIEDKMIQISATVKKGKKYRFEELVEGCDSKIEIVVMFLALLELIKMRDVRVFQEFSFSDIYVERIENNEGE